jgi:hypothetical protein
VTSSLSEATSVVNSGVAAPRQWWSSQVLPLTLASHCGGAPWQRRSATGALVTAVVGSGFAASMLSPADAGLRLAYTAAATAGAVAVLILLLLPLSGAHLNPAVTLVHWARERRRPGAAGAASAYLIAQLGGGAVGAVTANVMFGMPRWLCPVLSAPDLASGSVK